MDYFYKKISSPIGELKLVGNDAGLAAILWKNEKPGRVKIKAKEENTDLKIFKEAEKQLKEYFAGKRTHFDLPLNFHGTPFQKKVWKELLNIPFGKTVSYGEIAKKIGKPKAVRAVGGANNHNPISIIAACHRVVGTSGALTGYAGGMKAKMHLLTHEGHSFTGKDWKAKIAK